jgi:aminopeptidase N
LGDVALHAFYLPGDTLWPGRVIETLKKSLMFYDSVLGPYVYPQLTASRRLDGGGTEFPMMQMDGANPPVVHEAGHEWAHAMLANNEWKEGWLDEGFVSFLGFMYAEAAGMTPNYQRAVDQIAKLDASGNSQPMALPGAEFRDFNLYQTMAYTKPSLVIRMLRYYIGDEAFRKGLKLYYTKNVLTHVDENDFRTAFEQASGQNLGEFFQQWFHTTGTTDWGIKDATVKDLGNGSYETQITLTRAGDNYMPVDVLVAGKRVRVDSHERLVTLTVSSTMKPSEVVVDTDYVVIDPDRSNNKKVLE